MNADASPAEVGQASTHASGGRSAEQVLAPTMWVIMIRRFTLAITVLVSGCAGTSETDLQRINAERKILGERRDVHAVAVKVIALDDQIAKVQADSMGNSAGFVAQERAPLA
jgi:hypothetical protein